MLSVIGTGLWRTFYAVLLAGVSFLLVLGIIDTFAGRPSSDPVDFGKCTLLSTGDVQKCTYRDGHTEILKVGESTDRRS